MYLTFDMGEDVFENYASMKQVAPNAEDKFGKLSKRKTKQH
jgi:hypothetical protein